MWIHRWCHWIISWWCFRRFLSSRDVSQSLVPSVSVPIASVFLIHSILVGTYSLSYVSNSIFLSYLIFSKIILDLERSQKVAHFFHSLNRWWEICCRWGDHQFHRTIFYRVRVWSVGKMEWRIDFWKSCIRGWDRSCWSLSVSRICSICLSLHPS